MTTKKIFFLLILALLLAALPALPFPSVGVDCSVQNSYDKYIGVSVLLLLLITDY
jgi:hypothetical protein